MSSFQFSSRGSPPQPFDYRVSKESSDGLDNKERWHWKERDLRGWVNEWLMRACVQHEQGKLFEDPDMTGRCTIIRGDYNDGEVCSPLTRDLSRGRGNGKLGRLMQKARARGGLHKAWNGLGWGLVMGGSATEENG